MKTHFSHFPISLLSSFLFLFSYSSILGHDMIRGVSSLGINYGQVGNNLPPPEKVIALLRPLRLSQARIYDTNPTVLSAFANSGIDLVVTVENEMLSTLTDPQQALQWVSSRIRPFFPATNITGIAVGNEVFTDDDTSLAAYVVPAMESIHAALVKLGLDRYIHVSSPNSLAVMAVSYPPSSGCFRPELEGIMSEFLSFLQNTKSPFWINAYPYFAYKDDPKMIPLDYVLGNPSTGGMVDQSTGLKYDNMLYAQVDAVIFAVDRMGFGGVEVKVSETGWPSKGDPDETGATVENAAIYNRNLLMRQLRNEGTPMRLGTRLDVYVFALFNEDMKPGPTSERNYGLFHPDCTMAYNVGISNSLVGSSSSGSGSGSDSAWMSLTSSASKATNVGLYRSLVYCVIVYLTVIQVFMRRSPTLLIII